jgi:predicted AAA+ superfamily ATPase
MLPRPRPTDQIQALLTRFPIVALLGARQVGKSTLAHAIAASHPGETTFFDLEDPADAARLADPGLALRSRRGLVVLDEAQLRPDLFPLLRVLADRPDTPARFLLLGSASPDLVRASSESLAGRVATVTLGGLALDEVGPDRATDLWLRGGFPRSFLAPDDTTSAEWRRAFVQTFLERDLARLGIDLPAPALLRFWTMLAHGHGGIWNASELGRSFGVAHTTVRRWLDVLVGTFVVRTLQPWFENLGKRQVRSPKVYVADSGLLHTLLGLVTLEDVERHPKLGASWEGFALRVVTDAIGARPEECFFWATHQGAELDLLVVRGTRRWGFEIKRTETPALTRSMRIAHEDLRLDRLDVIHAGAHSYPLAEGVRAVALGRVLEDLEPLPG